METGKSKLENRKAKGERRKAKREMRKWKVEKRKTGQAISGQWSVAAHEGRWTTDPVNPKAQIQNPKPDPSGPEFLPARREAGRWRLETRQSAIFKSQITNPQSPTPNPQSFASSPSG
jgi:hypothetical protein